MEINKLSHRFIPERLKRIAGAPKQLFVLGDLSIIDAHKCVAIVGSRKISAYGRQVTAELAAELAEQGIVIISGLALGVDGTAHQAALEVGGLTIGVLPGPLEKIYPASHRQLARRIVAQGGVLVSEYPADSEMFPTNFVARNRLISGLADAVLITEAAEKSGSLHTADFALEQGKEVLAVPGNITSVTSVGTNNLIKVGATPITSYEDVLQALGLQPHVSVSTVKGRNPEEQAILALLLGGTTDGEDLQRVSRLDIAAFNQTLTMLEIAGKIRPLGANQWTLR